MTINRKTAHLLERVGAVFRITEGDTFRTKAYLNAAVAIENLPESIEDVWRRGELDKVPGIGVGLQDYLDEYFRKGRVRHFDAQIKKVPLGMFPLMELRGVGPMTAYKIAKKFHLKEEGTALAELKALMKEGKLKNLSGFKEKSVIRLKKAIKTRPSNKGRLLLADALVVAEKYIAYIKESPKVLDTEPLGSLRRRLPTVGDIDLAVNTKDIHGAMEHVLSYPEIKSIITRGDKVSRVMLHNGLEVDIKTSEPDSWGSLIQHYTGSKMHNIHLRTLAMNKGLSLSEYGIKKKNVLRKFKTEKDFYDFLGMQYIPPEIREDGGEIELGLRSKVPKLIEQAAIKGDLHIHSNYDFPSSHDVGDSSLSEILDEAGRLGYEYVGIADHNPKFTGLSENQKEKILIARKKLLELDFHAYEKRVKTRTINLLIGMEVDIRPDGGLALSENLLETLDYAIVSVHSNFDMTKEASTRRIIKGLSHPKAIILGHPTGRKLNDRESIALDWEKILDFCVKNNKTIEINAYPDRLDPPDELIRQGINRGVKFIINTDSHSALNMEYMKYGVWQARKGYATKRSVINTRSWKDLKRMLK